MRFPAVFLIAFSVASPAFSDEPLNSPPVQAPSIKTSAAVLNEADKQQLKRVETYLGNIQTISSHFSQVSPDGGVSNGKFYLQRPGKLRMEYDPPVPVLVITNGGNMVYYDKELDQVTHVPLSSTLVGFLARDKIRFDNTVIITDFEHGPEILRITFVQSEKPKDGAMTLELSDKPLALRNIIVADSTQQTTTVSLADARFDEKLDPSLFVFKDPHLSGKAHFKR